MLSLFPFTVRAKLLLLIFLSAALLIGCQSTSLVEITTAPQSITETELNNEVLIFLFCAFLMLVSHSAYYGFFSIHLENLGYGSTFIGLAWALASAAEIVVMVQSDRIFGRFSIESILIFSFMAAALRWFILYSASSAAAILLSQILHAATYGAFHIGSILYIDRLTPEKAKTLGQAVNNAISYGLGMMVGFFFNGYLYEIIGSFNLFLISCQIALFGGLFFWGFWLVDRQRLAK